MELFHTGRLFREAVKKEGHKLQSLLPPESSCTTNLRSKLVSKVSFETNRFINILLQETLTKLRIIKLTLPQRIIVPTLMQNKCAFECDIWTLLRWFDNVTRKLWHWVDRSCIDWTTWDLISTPVARRVLQGAARKLKLRLLWFAASLTNNS